MIALPITVIGVAILLIALALPLIYGKVGRNHFYGVRTAKTLSSDEMWYRTNKLGGQYFLAAGLVQLLLTVALCVAWPAAVQSATGAVLLLTVPIFIAMIAWLLKTRKW